MQACLDKTIIVHIERSELLPCALSNQDSINKAIETFLPHRENIYTIWNRLHLVVAQIDQLQLGKCSSVAGKVDETQIRKNQLQVGFGLIRKC